jgi:hypothetical protein
MENHKWDKLTLGAREVSIDDVVEIVDVLGSYKYFSDSFLEEASCKAFGAAEALVAEMASWSGLT